MGNLISSIKCKNHLKSEASHTPTLAVVVFLRRFAERLAGAENGAIFVAGEVFLRFARKHLTPPLNYLIFNKIR